MIKLHIGCGQRDFGPEWFHIDGGDFPHVKAHDVTKLEFPDKTVDKIYSSHLLSYFDRDQALEILKEWRRVLKPYGILRIAVPDWDMLIRACWLNGFKLPDVIGPLFGRMKMNDQWIYHKTVYDYHSIRELLYKAGYDAVYKYPWESTEHAHIDDHSKAHLPHDPEAIRTLNFTQKHLLISLNVEATNDKA